MMSDQRYKFLHDRVENQIKQESREAWSRLFNRFRRPRFKWDRRVQTGYVDVSMNLVDKQIVVTSSDISGQVNIDYNKAGQVVGIEYL